MAALQAADGEVVHGASCHCGRIKIEVSAPENLEVLDCNCTICTKKGFLHLIVPASKFRLVQGQDMTTYTWGTHTAKHHFCSVCGMAPYYIPRSHPDGFDVNARCLDGTTVKSMKIIPFDGRESWDKEAAAVSHLSKEEGSIS